MIKTCNLLKYFVNKQPKLAYNHKIAFCFSSLPYRLGGLMHSEINKSKRHLLYLKMMEELFGSSLQSQLKSAYRSVLEAIHEKDIDMLEDVMEPRLLQDKSDILGKNLSLKNAQADIQLHIGRINLIIFFPFIRKDFQSSMLIKSLETESQMLKQYHTIRQGQVWSKTENQKVLLTMEVYYKSKMKLVQADQQNENDDEQWHMIQFQTENILEFQDQREEYHEIIERYFLMEESLGDLSEQAIMQLEKMAYKVREHGQEWKIGDMDKVLNGNFPQIMEFDQKPY